VGGLELQHWRRASWARACVLGVLSANLDGTDQASHTSQADGLGRPNIFVQLFFIFPVFSFLFLFFFFLHFLKAKNIYNAKFNNFV
jgi:hypothetical protein